MFVMCLISLLHIPGFSFGGGGTSLTGATPQSQTGFAPASTQPASGLSTLGQQPQTGFSFGAPSTQATPLAAATPTTTASAVKLNFGSTPSSTPSTGELCSGYVLYLILIFIE